MTNGVVELAPGVTVSTFFDEYWQKKPLFMPGMAEFFVGSLMDYREALSVIAAARHKNSVRLTSDPGRTDFLRGADTESPRLASRALGLQATLGLPGLTFDVVLTHAAGGIGCHFDDTDNFVVQNAGTKNWQIGPVDALPKADMQRRLLRFEGYEWRAFMPHVEDVSTYQLNAGDVLYVPLNAPHWGRAEGPSISTPLVFNVRTGLEELLPLMQEVLADNAMWWGPAPAYGRLPDDADLAPFLDVVQTPEFRSTVLGLWRERRRHNQAVYRPVTSQMTPTGKEPLGARCCRWI